ncbi:MAG TPA: hypothetical protein VLJ16_07620, partial [Acidobacteriota bacterium]|nr:hypothetical protein [Acidobacteriota bacterium]
KGRAGVWVMEKSASAEEAEAKAKAKVMVGVEGKDFGSISLVFTGQEGEAGQAAFERAIASMKKDLPEGYKIAEQSYDPDTGTMKFKISAPEGRKTDKALIEKLVESVRAAIKSEK